MHACRRYSFQLRSQEPVQSQSNTDWELACRWFRENFHVQKILAAMDAVWQRCMTDTNPFGAEIPTKEKEQ